MTKPTLIIGNKNYSSWSLLGWLALTMLDIDFEKNDPAVPGRSRRKKGGQVIWESLAIFEYAAEMKPGANMWQKDTAERNHAHSVTAEMAPSFFGLRDEIPQTGWRYNAQCRRPERHRQGSGFTNVPTAIALSPQSLWSQ
ncbi:MAG: hypothetical protein QGF71_03075 [Rhodospirillales bacterium]|nr:hypothetical protein [Rhodospirillales bacterium]